MKDNILANKKKNTDICLRTNNWFIEQSQKINIIISLK